MRGEEKEGSKQNSSEGEASGAQEFAELDSEGLYSLEARVNRGEFRFGDTLRLKHLKKVNASKEARRMFEASGAADLPKLYAYIVSLEKRLEALEEWLRLKMG